MFGPRASLLGHKSNGGPQSWLVWQSCKRHSILSLLSFTELHDWVKKNSRRPVDQSDGKSQTLPNLKIQKSQKSFFRSLFASVEIICLTFLIVHFVLTICGAAVVVIPLVLGCLLFCRTSGICCQIANSKNIFPLAEHYSNGFAVLLTVTLFKHVLCSLLLCMI